MTGVTRNVSTLVPRGANTTEDLFVAFPPDTAPDTGGRLALVPHVVVVGFRAGQGC